MEEKRKKIIVISIVCLILLIIIIAIILNATKDKETVQTTGEQETTQTDDANKDKKILATLSSIEFKNAKQLELKLSNDNSELTSGDLNILINGVKVEFTIEKLENGNYEITLDRDLKEQDTIKVEANGKFDGELEKIYTTGEENKEDKASPEPITTATKKPITLSTKKPTNNPTSKPATKPSQKPVTPVVNKYTVTFNSNGGSEVASQTIEDGKTATCPAEPTKSGYTFLGWTLNGAAYDFSSAVKGNITLVASWKQNEDVYTYKVSLINNDEFTPSRVVYVYKNGTKISNVTALYNSNGQILGKYKSELGGIAIDKADQGAIAQVKLSDGSMKRF